MTAQQLARSQVSCPRCSVTVEKRNETIWPKSKYLRSDAVVLCRSLLTISKKGHQSRGGGILQVIMTVLLDSNMEGRSIAAHWCVFQRTQGGILRSDPPQGQLFESNS